MSEEDLRGVGRKGSSRIPLPSSSAPRNGPLTRFVSKLPSKSTPLSSPLATPSTSASPLMDRFRRFEKMAKAEARSRDAAGQPGTLSKGTIPWVEKHFPRSVDDLFVHKKKVEDVINWLGNTGPSLPPHGNQRKSMNKMSNICVLSGPAGCGKTATIQLVGKQLEFDVKEWINPMSLTQSQFRQGENDGGFGYKDDIQGRSQVDTFVDFLFRTAQYRSLLMKGKSAMKNRLILVEDIPNTFYRDPNVFHDILRKYASTGPIPLVFVFTDSSNSEHSMFRMFPKSLMTDLNISNISFNPVAPTLMTKFLLEICTKESIAVDRSQVDEIAVTANGDLRCAVNNLQFSLTKERVGTDSKSVFKKPPAKRARKPDGKLSEAGEAQQKDNTIQLFRALGKVLYAKREESQINQVEYELPEELESDRRIHPLIENPESICDKVDVSADTLIGFLHQNYPGFYGSLEEMKTASEYLSISDFVLNAWKFDDSGAGKSFKVREVKDLVGMNIAVRGLMHSNTNRISQGWKPLTKPLISNMDNHLKESVEGTRQALFHLRELQSTLFTETIPLYAKLFQVDRSRQTAGRRDILEKGLFQRKSVRTVNLDEKETVDEEPEVPEEERIVNEGDGANQIKNSVLNVAEEPEDEEFLIEEFD